MDGRRVRNTSRLSILYVVLATILLAQTLWWVLFLSSMAEDVADETERRLRTELRLVRTRLAADDLDAETVRAEHPDFVAEAEGDSLRVDIDPDALRALRARAVGRQRMLIAEGAFFVLLLAMGTFVLVAAERKERAFRRAHELFLAGVTHEFRTPLASIRLSAETLAREGLDETAHRRLQARLLADTERLQTLVAQVLTVTRDGLVPSGATTRVNLSSVIDRVVDETSDLVAAARGTLRVEAPVTVYVRGQEDALALVVRNLVVNAIEHGHAAEVAPHVEIDLRSVGRRAALSVVDHGPGIPDEERDQVFRAFQRGSHGSRAGAGLGLYLARRLVESMGGELDLERSPSGGATFRVRMPLEGEAT